MSGLRSSSRDHRFDQPRDDFALDFGVGQVALQLRRDHHRFDRGRAIVLIAHRDLGLGIGPQPGQFAAPAQLLLALHQPVGQLDRQRHQLRRLITGVAEHQALVAGPEHPVGPFHAAGDLRRLAVHPDQHLAGLGVDAREAGAVAGLAQQLPHNAVELGADPLEGALRAEAELAGHHDQVIGKQCLAGNPGIGVERQTAVQDRVRDAVGELVRVAVRDGLGGEEIAVVSSAGLLRNPTVRPAGAGPGSGDLAQPL